MTDVIPPDTLPPLDDEARELGQNILKAAFAVIDGPQRLAEALQGTGINLFDDIYAQGMTNKAMIHALVEHLCEDQALTETTIQRLFVNLAGDAAVRGWVVRYRPALLPLVPDTVHQTARLIYERRLQAGQIGQVLEGLEQIAPDSQRHPLTPELRRTLEQVEAGLARISLFKSAHDFLHDVQTQVLVQADALALDAVSGDRGRFLQVLVRDVEDAARKGGVLEAKAATLNLAEEVQPFTAGMAPLAVDLAARAAAEPAPAVEDLRYELRFLVRNHLPRLHNLLAGTVRDVPFEALLALLNTARAGNDAPALVNAGTALGALIPRLEDTLDQHRLWQEVDREIWALDDSLPGIGLPAGVVHRHWGAVVRRLKLLAERDFRCDYLLTQADQLAAAAGAGTPDTAGTPAFVRAARLAFQQTDKMLLSQCEEFLLLRPALANILDPSS